MAKSERRQRLTAPAVERLQPQSGGGYRVYDSTIPRLFVRVQPSGIKSYNVQWSASSSVVIGKHPEMLPDMAREKALTVLREAASGTPETVQRKRDGKPATLATFLASDYRTAAAHLKWGEGAARRIESAFADMLTKPLTEITAWTVEKWRAKRLKAGKAPGTVNRELASLKSALSKAVAAGLLPAHPLASVKLRAVDNARVRYLSPAEETALRNALAGRDRETTEARARANAWRAARGYNLLPALPVDGYCDHLSPLVLVALNTGLRRGELTALQWSDVDLPAKRLLVRAAAAKSGKARHVPLNSEACLVLARWKAQGTDTTVFPIRDAKKAWLAVASTAKLEGFNFHDLRHSFASKLVMAGVDLNTVRELLGHADLKMTLRYAHLAAEHKVAAVELLTLRPTTARSRRAS